MSAPVSGRNQWPCGHPGGSEDAGGRPSIALVIVVVRGRCDDASKAPGAPIRRVRWAWEGWFPMKASNSDDPFSVLWYAVVCGVYLPEVNAIPCSQKWLKKVYRSIAVFGGQEPLDVLEEERLRPHSSHCAKDDTRLFRWSPFRRIPADENP